MKYTSSFKLRRKYILDNLKKRSIYFSVGLGLLSIALIEKYYQNAFINIVAKIIYKKKVAYYLATHNLNYFNEYLLVAGGAMIILCPLLKNKKGHRNVLILSTIITILFCLFFGIFGETVK